MLYLVDKKLDEVSGLSHGFGKANFKESDLRDLAKSRGFRVVLMDQIHSDVIHIIEDALPSRPSGDALVTKVPGLLLVVKTADCLPLLLADKKLRVIAAVHAGWRGTRSRIVRKAVEAMAARFGTRPEDLVAAFGPCIGASCYEVGEDVRREFVSAGFPDDLFVPAGRPGKFLFDLGTANLRELRAAGVPVVSAAEAAPCPHCDPEFHSYRRDRDTLNRMFSFIGLEP